MFPSIFGLLYFFFSNKIFLESPASFHMIPSPTPQVAYRYGEPTTPESSGVARTYNTWGLPCSTNTGGSASWPPMRGWRTLVERIARWRSGVWPRRRAVECFVQVMVFCATFCRNRWRQRSFVSFPAKKVVFCSRVLLYVFFLMR